MIIHLTVDPLPCFQLEIFHWKLNSLPKTSPCMWAVVALPTCLGTFLKLYNTVWVGIWMLTLYLEHPPDKMDPCVSTTLENFLKYKYALVNIAAVLWLTFLISKMLLCIRLSMCPKFQIFLLNLMKSFPLGVPKLPH